MNGLPVNTYQEVTSQFWNLIYKPSMMEDDTLSDDPLKKDPNLQKDDAFSIIGIEREFQNHYNIHKKI